MPVPEPFHVLFNSFEFLFAFLPLAWVVYQLLTFSGFSRTALAWLCLTSIFFYGYWDPRYLLLLALSMVVNFSLGTHIGKAGTGDSSRLWILRLGVVFNLALLAYFKYAGLIVETINALTGTGFAMAKIALPLGISFFTFQQIAYLVDRYRLGIEENDPLRYVLFVTFFPHLIAGPLVHHREMMPQFGTQRKEDIPGDLLVGASILAIGLFKKVIVADAMAVNANFVFDHALTSEPTFLEAWVGALAYTMQIYFDFSGYSDMAIGLGRMFGIVLPVNFASPYKADSIIDFWRRWHITLSRFLRDYLYYALGGNRQGRGRRYANLMTTMLLGGMWHGASWTFLFWGGLHGCYLVVNHLWQAAGGALPRWLARVVTFVFVVIAWIPFRAETFPAMLRIYRGMLDLNGISLPAGVASQLAKVPGLVETFGITGGGLGILERLTGFLGLPAAIAFTWFLPATHELLAKYGPALPTSGYPATEVDKDRPGRIHWKPNFSWAFCLGILFGMCVLSLNEISEFIYFNF